MEVLLPDKLAGLGIDDEDVVGHARNNHEFPGPAGRVDASDDERLEEGVGRRGAPLCPVLSGISFASQVFIYVFCGAEAPRKLKLAPQG